LQYRGDTPFGLAAIFNYGVAVNSIFFEGLYSSEDLDFAEYMFHYGDMHFPFSVDDIPVRKIKSLLAINQKRIVDEEMKRHDIPSSG
jgi:hypothetical protein